MPSGIYKPTEEYRKKMSEAAKKNWKNPEFRAKIFEAGKNQNPTLNTLKKVAKALDVSVDDLIG